MSSDLDAQLKQIQEQLQVERQRMVDDRRLRVQAENHAEQERKLTEEHCKVLNELGPIKS